MSENQNTKSVESIEVATNRAMQEVAKVEGIAGHWRARAYKAEKELTRQREEKTTKGSILGRIVDGQDVHYWHQIATSTLKTNNELIDRVKELDDECDAIGRRSQTLETMLREKERINADLEQQLKSAEIAAQTVEKKREDEIKALESKVEWLRKDDQQIAMKLNQLQRDLIHQQGCAKTAQDERDAALRELDAMREKIEPVPPEPHNYFFRENSQSRRIQITKEAFFAMRDSAPKIGHSWTVDCMRPNESTLTFYT